MILLVKGQSTSVLFHVLEPKIYVQSYERLDHDFFCDDVLWEGF